MISNGRILSKMMKQKKKKAGALKFLLSSSVLHQTPQRVPLNTTDNCQLFQACNWNLEDPLNPRTPGEIAHTGPSKKLPEAVVARKRKEAAPPWMALESRLLSVELPHCIVVGIVCRHYCWRRTNIFSSVHHAASPPKQSECNPVGEKPL